MKKLICASVALIFSITLANADDPYFVQQKRAEAEAQRMALLQEIQHKQSNPQAYLANLDKKTEPASVSFDPAPNGHYYISALINGRSVDFIADTGASSIFLTQNDARRVGLNVENLNYNKIYNTANGQVKAAATTIPAFKVGPIELSNVEVSVSSVADGQSLLGMSFFHQLNSYDVKNNVLTLYK